MLQNKSNHEIYLEWCNDFLTIAYMAEYYQVSKHYISEKIRLGAIENEKLN